MSSGSTGMRACVAFLLAAAAALTALLAFRTFWYLFHSITNVPFTDGWLLLDEVRRFREGASRWTYLWQPYWGQRPLVVRVLFLLSARFLAFSALPLILTNAAAELSLVFVLIRAARAVFPASPRLFLAAAIVLAHLVLSSIGMEMVAVTQNAQHSIGYAAAISAILVFHRRPWLGILLATLATASLAIGLFLWPIFIFQAWRLRVPIGAVVILTAIGAAMIALYMNGYARPPAYGIGLWGAVRHPLVMLQMTSLILGGPITLYSLRLGTLAGAIGLAALAWFVCRPIKTPALGFTMVACLLAASAATLAIGRISPEWIASLHGAQPLPSRYIYPTLIFWGALFVLAGADLVPVRRRLTAPAGAEFPVRRRLVAQAGAEFPVRGRLAALAGSDLLPRGRLVAAAISAIVLIMTFGTWSWQWRLPREWAVYWQKNDAIASGFLTGVSDPELMSILLADDPIRDRLVDYMRREHLSVFAEPRASWFGRQLGTRLRPVTASCRATLSALPAGQGLRVTGTVESASRDLLIADLAGNVVGLARTLPAQSEGRRATDFLGYARADSIDRVHLFAMLPGGSLCGLDSSK